MADTLDAAADRLERALEGLSERTRRLRADSRVGDDDLFAASASGPSVRERALEDAAREALAALDAAEAAILSRLGEED